jgi:hypothetical protein
MFDESDEAPKPVRGERGQFKKGVAANPGGWSKADRAAHKDLKEAARRYTGKALRTLVAILDNNRAPASAKAQAAATILDRGWGRVGIAEGDRREKEITVRWIGEAEGEGDTIARTWADRIPDRDRPAIPRVINGKVNDHNG